MNMTESAALGLPPGQPAEVRVIKPLQLDHDTPQTNGMRRLAAISRVLVGAEALWAGVMLAEPDTASSVHHHGPLETGDFVYIPPYMPHQEINPSPDQPTQWIVVRSGGEAVLVNLTELRNGEYVPANIDNSKHLTKEKSSCLN